MHIIFASKIYHKNGCSNTLDMDDNQVLWEYGCYIVNLVVSDENIETSYISCYCMSELIHIFFSLSVIREVSDFRHFVYILSLIVNQQFFFICNIKKCRVKCAMCYIVQVMFKNYIKNIVNKINHSLHCYFVVCWIPTFVGKHGNHKNGTGVFPTSYFEIEKNKCC